MFCGEPGGDVDSLDAAEVKREDASGHRDSHDAGPPGEVLRRYAAKRSTSVFNHSTDGALIEGAMRARNVHPEEIRRVVELGAAPETVGQELLLVLQSPLPGDWYTSDLDDPHYQVTNIHKPAAIELEARAAAGIAAVSRYERLFVGCTDVDASPDPDVIHVNVLPEDMRFAASGLRLLIDGRKVPLPGDFFKSSQGMHIPFDLALTPPLISDLFRTLRKGSVLTYAPSTNVHTVMVLMRNAGFVNVSIVGLAPRTLYRGRITMPTQIVQATKP